MPKIPLEPMSAPKILVYKYFYDKLHGKLSYDGESVDFHFSKEKADLTKTCVYLEFYRKIPSSNRRYVGDTIVAQRVSDGLYQEVTIGEPYECYWKVVISSSDSRDACFEVDQQIRSLMGRTGCIYDPVYVSHDRYESLDFDGDNNLMKEEADTLLYENTIGYRTYMRLSGGVPNPDYTPRPIVEEISLTLEVDEKFSREVTIRDENP